ncbi:MAG TPA: hypothetical protein VMX33_08030 [bacterium]|nr:hypothetical protein [bacterium]
MNPADRVVSGTGDAEQVQYAWIPRNIDTAVDDRTSPACDV